MNLSGCYNCAISSRQFGLNSNWNKFKSKWEIFCLIKPIHPDYPGVEASSNLLTLYWEKNTCRPVPPRSWFDLTASRHSFKFRFVSVMKATTRSPHPSVALLSGPALTQRQWSTFKSPHAPSWKRDKEQVHAFQIRQRKQTPYVCVLCKRFFNFTDLWGLNRLNSICGAVVIVPDIDFDLLNVFSHDILPSWQQPEKIFCRNI